MKYYRNLIHDSINALLTIVLADGSEHHCQTIESVINTSTSDTTSIVINGNTFIKNQVKSVYFGNNWNLDYIPDNFCFYFNNLTYIDPLPDMITSIGNNFMQYCISFNSSITLPSSLKTIGSIFMRDCISFKQPLILPNSITSIGNYFMHNCTSFNQPFIIPNSVISIGDNFMYRLHQLSSLYISENFIDAITYSNYTAPATTTTNSNFTYEWEAENNLSLSAYSWYIINGTNNKPDWTSITNLQKANLEKNQMYNPGIKIFGLSIDKYNELLELKLPNISGAHAKVQYYSKMYYVRSAMVGRNLIYGEGN